MPDTFFLQSEYLGSVCIFRSKEKCFMPSVYTYNYSPLKYYADPFIPSMIFMFHFLFNMVNMDNKEEIHG